MKLIGKQWFSNPVRSVQSGLKVDKLEEETSRQLCNPTAQN